LNLEFVISTTTLNKTKLQMCNVKTKMEELLLSYDKD